MTLPKHQLAGPLEKKTGKDVWNMLQESKPQVWQKLADVSQWKKCCDNYLEKQENL